MYLSRVNAFHLNDVFRQQKKKIGSIIYIILFMTSKPTGIHMKTHNIIPQNDIISMIDPFFIVIVLLNLYLTPVIAISGHLRYCTRLN